VAARKQAELVLPEYILSHNSSTETVLTITFRLRSATSWADASHEIAWWQHKLPSQSSLSISNPSAGSSHKLQVQNLKSTVQIYGSSWSLKFDRARGYLTNWVSAGVTLLEPDSLTGVAMTPSFWRAPTDNDVPISLPYWRRFGVDDMTSQLRSWEVLPNSSEGVVEIMTRTYLAPPILGWGFHAETTYSIFPNGSWAVKVKLHPTGSYPITLPRIGLDVTLPKALEEVTWSGLGPGESYPDKRSSQKVGIWSKIVPELQTRYEVPQENGNRMDTRWVKLLSHSVGIMVTGGPTKEGTDATTFQWGAGPHRATALEAARHPCDLVEEDSTLLKLNAEVAGVGSAACGPGVGEEFEVKCRDTEFGFFFQPIGL